MSKASIPSRVKKELTNAFNKAGFEIMEMTMTSNQHVRIRFQNDAGQKGIVHTGLTSSDKRRDKNVIQDARRSLREQHNRQITKKPAM